MGVGTSMVDQNQRIRPSGLNLGTQDLGHGFGYLEGLLVDFGPEGGSPGMCTCVHYQCHYVFMRLCLDLCLYVAIALCISYVFVRVTFRRSKRSTFRCSKRSTFRRSKRTPDHPLKEAAWRIRMSKWEKTHLTESYSVVHPSGWKPRLSPDSPYLPYTCNWGDNQLANSGKPPNANGMCPAKVPPTAIFVSYLGVDGFKTFIKDGHFLHCHISPLPGWGSIRITGATSNQPDLSARFLTSMFVSTSESWQQDHIFSFSLFHPLRSPCFQA